MCALTECTNTMFCIWLNGGSMSRNMSPKFLILITNICCVYWPNKLLYYCKTHRDGCYKKTRVQYFINVLKMAS